MAAEWGAFRVVLKRLVPVGVLVMVAYRYVRVRRPVVLWPDEVRWAGGTRIRWTDEPYVDEGPHGEVNLVRAGDERLVVVDDSPIEFVVTFPATGAFCTPRSSVERVANGD